MTNHRWPFRRTAVVSNPKPVNVREVRRRMGMTQDTFAARFGFSLGALRHWERGERRPTGAALTLLNVIAHQPRAVLVALRAPLPKRFFRPKIFRRTYLKSEFLEK